MVDVNLGMKEKQDETWAGLKVERGTQISTVDMCFLLFRVVS